MCITVHCLLKIFCVSCLFMTCDNDYYKSNCAHIKVHLMTGCHAEAQSRKAQGSGMWEVWTVITPNFPSILCPQKSFRTENIVQFFTRYQAAKQLSICRGRLPIAWVLALLVICCLITINSMKLVKWVIVRASNPSRPDLNQSSNSAFVWEQYPRYDLHQDTAGIQQ